MDSELTDDERRMLMVAERIGLTAEEFRELKRLADETAERGRGMTLAEWANATNRDQRGRKRTAR